MDGEDLKDGKDTKDIKDDRSTPVSLPSLVSLLSFLLGWLYGPPAAAPGRISSNTMPRFSTPLSRTSSMKAATLP